MTREEIIQQNNLVDFLTDRGATFKQSGSSQVTNTCPVTGHKESHLCVSIDPEKNLWHCNDCEKGGSVIDWVMAEKQVTAAEAMNILSGDVAPSTGPSSATALSPGESKEIAVYHYTNENGQLLYQVVRYEPKTFRQRQPKGADWQWDLNGVTRVLYNLPEVLKAKVVCVTEGEKDANNLNSLGFVATTNAGGSKNWLDAYADYLKGKDVIVFEDNDSAGKLWGDKVVQSCTDVANSVKRVKAGGKKDISELIEEARLEGKAPDKIATTVQAMIDKTPHVVEPLPIFSIAEMEEQFATNINDERQRMFSMAKFSPAFGKISNGCMPGDVIMIVADTSQGKTAVMQSIAVSASPLETLIFELELPMDQMFMRGVQMQRNCYQSDIIKAYKENPKGRFADKFDKLQHIMICPNSGLAMEDIERYIIKSELKFGNRPGLVFIDYMGLVDGKRDGYRMSGYERMAYNANQAKVVAKRTGTIVCMGSQVARPEGARDHVKDVKIHHAKGAGELENSSNLVLGLSRPEDKILKMKVLKNTSGPVGAEIEFDFDPAKMQIKERMIQQ